MILDISFVLEQSISAVIFKNPESWILNPLYCISLFDSRGIYGSPDLSGNLRSSLESPENEKKSETFPMVTKVHKVISDTNMHVIVDNLTISNTNKRYV